MASSDNAPVWFVTGCSSGFGREISRVALERGKRLVATARNVEMIEELRAAYPQQVLALPLDVTDRKQIAEAVARAHERFGQIDVLVNNAGRGYLASVEEGEEAQIRGLMETNFFGLVWMTQAVLPIMRAQKSGTIANMSSVGGLSGNLGHGYYGASKFAVEGLSDALAKEVNPLGIHVVLFEPGPYRTEFFGRSITAAKSGIEDYAPTVGARNTAILKRVQVGDPRLAAELMVTAIDTSPPPKRLVLGKLGIDVARAKLQDVASDIDAWETASLATDRPAS